VEIAEALRNTAVHTVNHLCSDSCVHYMRQSVYSLDCDVIGDGAQAEYFHTHAEAKEASDRMSSYAYLQSVLQSERT
jgi:hypothetical protein